MDTLIQAVLIIGSIILIFFIISALFKGLDSGLERTTGKDLYDWIKFCFYSIFPICGFIFAIVIIREAMAEENIGMTIVGLLIIIWGLFMLHGAWKDVL